MSAREPGGSCGRDEGEPASLDRPQRRLRRLSFSPLTAEEALTRALQVECNGLALRRTTTDETRPPA